MSEKQDKQTEKEYLVKLGYVTCFCGHTGDAHECKVEKF